MTCNISLDNRCTDITVQFYKPLSQIIAEQGLGFSWPAHMICKHDRLDEESENINNYGERINYSKTSKVSQNIVIRDCGQQQNS